MTGVLLIRRYALLAAIAFVCSLSIWARPQPKPRAKPSPDPTEAKAEVAKQLEATRLATLKQAEEAAKKKKNKRLSCR
jgi:hypothetical protein